MLTSAAAEVNRGGKKSAVLLVEDTIFVLRDFFKKREGKKEGQDRQGPVSLSDGTQEIRGRSLV